MPALRDTAAYYSVGLAIGLHTVHDVLNWAEAEIRALDHPPQHLFELLVGDDPKPQRLIDRLAEFPGEPDEQHVLRSILRGMHGAMQRDPRQGPRWAKWLYVWYLGRDGEPPNAIYVVDHYYEEASEGFRDIEEAHEYFIEFLRSQIDPR